jgi:hypothetical protein
MKLKAGSPLIDKGTDVELPFVGAAPDLGAYEFGAPLAGSGGDAPVGGASGSGGGGAGALAGGAGNAGLGGSGPTTGGAAPGGDAGSSPLPAAAGRAGSGAAGAPGMPGDEAAAGCSCAMAGGSRAAHGSVACLLLAFILTRRASRLSRTAR